MCDHCLESGILSWTAIRRPSDSHQTFSGRPLGECWTTIMWLWNSRRTALEDGTRAFQEAVKCEINAVRKKKHNKRRKLLMLVVVEEMEVTLC